MAPRPQKLTITRRACALKHSQRIDGEERTSVDVIVAELSDGDSQGRGECVPMRRFGETADSVIAALEAARAAIAFGLSRDTLQQALPPGAARNALDCAFWDIDAKRLYRSAAEIAGLAGAAPLITARSIAHDTPAAMAAAAAAERDAPLLRLVLGGDGDIERLRGVREAAPTARLIVDAEERWSPAQLHAIMPVLADLRVELLEQPLKAEDDAALAGVAWPLPICADEACRSRADLDRLAGKYAAINIRLDKAGGLTEALALAAEAKARGLQIMASGPIATSLAIAPALLLAGLARFVDLDGPTHLALDRGGALRYDRGRIHPAGAALWGGPG